MNDGARERELTELGINAEVEWDGHGPAVVTLDIAQLDQLISLADMTPALDDEAAEDAWNAGYKQGEMDAEDAVKDKLAEIVDVLDRLLGNTGVERPSTAPSNVVDIATGGRV